MWECFAEVVKSDEGLEKKIVEVIESTQKENEAGKEDRVIQTFKAEHEKLNEEEEVKVMKELEKALNENEEADGGTEVQQNIERGYCKRDEMSKLMELNMQMVWRLWKGFA